MTASDLSKYQNNRFKHNCICKICKRKIENQEFDFLTTKAGRLVKYNFFHLDCLLKDTSSQLEEKGE